ncbi:hypothetical protein ARMGADRAFT_1029524 [Armillaria gallica]|uniref:Uncharacterized protein n=1 Tax=Armillaria gallica TaxID=47427 RepID=A0A2H3DGQ9_ARMGA|nr:hypothetical protein ARMGADRAFT_1029524 [Armillaria gallica]
MCLVLHSLLVLSLLCRLNLEKPPALSAAANQWAMQLPPRNTGTGAGGSRKSKPKCSDHFPWAQPFDAEREVPLNALVMVGYTLSMYKNSNDYESLYTNLQFVILLGKAKPSAIVKGSGDDGNSGEDGYGDAEGSGSKSRGKGKATGKGKGHASVKGKGKACQ